MVHDLLSKLSKLINSSDDIKLDDIPEYRLYISQLEEFFDKKLGKAGSDEEDRKAISKTMIQNYIKDGLLMPPEGKCYNRSHVVLLALIYSLKSILSIRDIRRLLNPILSDIDNDDNSSEIINLYENYLRLKTKSVQNMSNSMYELAGEVMEQFIPGNKTDEEKDRIRLLLFVSVLIAEANYYKRIAEFLIDEYFENID